MKEKSGDERSGDLCFVSKNPLISVLLQRNADLPVPHRPETVTRNSTWSLRSSSGFVVVLFLTPSLEPLKTVNEGMVKMGDERELLTIER